MFCFDCDQSPKEEGKEEKRQKRKKKKKKNYAYQFIPPHPHLIFVHRSQPKKNGRSRNGSTQRPRKNR